MVRGLALMRGMPRGAAPIRIRKPSSRPSSGEEDQSGQVPPVALAVFSHSAECAVSREPPPL